VDANLPDDDMLLCVSRESAIGVTPGFLVAIAKMVVDRSPRSTSIYSFKRRVPAGKPLIVAIITNER
jgi:hypothetical protein